MKALIRWLISAIFERYLGIDTRESSSASTVGGRHHDSGRYEALHYIALGWSLRAMKLVEDDVVFDIGCGKGRALCLLARKRVKRCVGIELSDELARRARENVARVRGRRASVEVVVIDAAVADYTDGTVFYMFNPFGAATMAEVLNRIHVSLLQHPRCIRIVYATPAHADILDKAGWLKRVGGTRSPWSSVKTIIWIGHLPES